MTTRQAKPVRDLRPIRRDRSGVGVIHARLRPWAVLAALSLCSLLPLLAATPTAAATAAATATGDEAVAYQIDAAHDGRLSGGPEVPPLTERWSRDVGGLVSYPIITAGKVFVTVASTNGQYGTTLYALDAATGADAWGPVELGGTYFWSALTTGDGQLFALNYDGLLRSFDVATGAQQWAVQLPGQYAFSSAPTYFGGVVYSGGAGSGGTVYATRASDGALLWTAPVANGDNSSPAVSDTGVYVSYACAQAYDFDPATGSELWHHSTFCSGGGGRTPVLEDGHVWVRDPITGNVELDAATGSPVNTFIAQPAPAFDGQRGFFLENGVLQARDAGSLAPLWSFTGDGNLTSAPIVVNGFVYEASSSGQLWALDESTGLPVWSTDTGSPILGPDEQNVSQPLTGLGAGQGLVVVPASNRLIAYEPSSTMATPTLTTAASGGVRVSGRIHDTATLAGGSSPTGMITFKLYGPDTSCSGPPVFTSRRRVTGNGTYRSANFKPTVPGNYRWQARYSGDANNQRVKTACKDAAEVVVVSPRH